MTDHDSIFFNGIDGDTGQYHRSPRPASAMAPLLAGFVDRGIPRPLQYGVDARDLSQAGWAVVWPAEDPDGVRREALAPLLDWRRTQAGDVCRQLEVYPGESALEFRERYGAGPGPVDPMAVPYYVLLVGNPEEISFEFQSELATAHAVGRLDLETPEHYEAYARALVELESAETTSPKHMAFFGAEHRDDPLTWSSSEHLVGGLQGTVARAHRDWDISTLLRHAAKKEALDQLLHGSHRPSILFTASHGLTYRPGSDGQATHQGALLCADYPGRKVWGDYAIPEEHLFAAPDLREGARLPGLVACHFACYSAGTPRVDTYAGQSPKLLADRAFVAPLAKGLLRRGALGVVGHVDSTFEDSYFWHRAGPQTNAFEGLLRAIMDGEPLGHAMRFMTDRFCQLAVGVTAAVRRIRRNEANEETLRDLRHWAAYEDARHFILLGDPAARLQT